MSDLRNQPGTQDSYAGLHSGPRRDPLDHGTERDAGGKPVPTFPHPAPALAAAAVALGAAAVLAGAWFFQLVVGLAPCPLCLQQRIPYYVAVPLAALVAVAAARGAPRRLVILALALLAGVLLVGAGLGAYHAGVEWKWWAGPQDCTGAGGFSAGSAGGLMQRMQTARVVRCDEAAWRFLGLSLAGWNVLVALALAGIALAGIARAFSSKVDTGSREENATQK